MINPNRFYPRVGMRQEVKIASMLPVAALLILAVYASSSPAYYFLREFNTKGLLIFAGVYRVATPYKKR